MKKNTIVLIISILALTISINAQTNCDIWIATDSTTAPIARMNHTAVWTGTEMIVWGGIGITGYLNSGGRYNPITDTWIVTSTVNVPSGRMRQSAVWTGSEMIIWGGEATNYSVSVTGGKYNPITDTWVATSTVNTPSARSNQTAVWTGAEMIVWGGGYYLAGTYVNTGGKYNPTTDTWVTTSINNAPVGRWGQSVVWTGTEMIVWGGFDYAIDYNTGGRYNPITDIWTATSIINAPVGRAGHRAVWTGTEMIVWGGGITNTNTGGRYNPTTNIWTATSLINAPLGRSFHTAIMTSCSEMIVWGGVNWQPIQTFPNTGGRYDPVSDSWVAISTTNVPNARHCHTTVWTGTQMIIWGGSNSNNTGGKYVPCCDDYDPTSIINTSNKSNNIIIYPNPANSYITIKNNEPNSIIKLFNLSGQLLKEQKLNDIENTIDIKDLTSGIYMLEIKSDKNIHHSKIIKE